MMTLGALLVLGAWCFGRWWSDELEWSQYLFWVPSPAVLMGAAVLLLVSSGLARKARGLAGADSLGSRPPAARARRLAWGLWVGVLAWVCVAEYHVQRYLPRVGTNPGGAAVRFMYWNPSQTEYLADHVGAVGPAVLVVANAPGTVNWGAVRGAMSVEGGATYAVRYERFTVVSRYPVLRWAGTGLGIQGAKARAFIWRGGGYVVQDEGQAVFVELDTRGALGRTTVVWALDLPSDFNLSRWVVMRQGAKRLAEFEGPAFERAGDGMDRPVSLEHGFPSPDVIVGDFNTPRGSASLSEIVGSMANAFDQAGRGISATYPREWPVVAIDQAFVGPDLRARKYDVLDLQEGQHRAVVFDVAEREP